MPSPAAPTSAATRQTAEQTTPADEPYAEFAVYDDEPDIEWVYEAEAISAPKVKRRKRVQPRRVNVPLSVLYAQGILLAVVGLGAFILGWLAGATPKAAATAGVPQPCTLSGEVRYVTQSGQELPDDGAVVLVLPMDQRPAPTDKADVAGLRPGDPLPRSDSENLRIIEGIGGGYARTDAAGRYQVRLPNVGKYHVLVISNHAVRPRGEELGKTDIAQLGRYVQPPTDLLDRSKYVWREVNLRGNRTINFAF